MVQPANFSITQKQQHKTSCTHGFPYIPAQIFQDHSVFMEGAESASLGFNAGGRWNAPCEGMHWCHGCSVEEVWEHCTSCSLIPDTLATSAPVEAENCRSVPVELFWSDLGSTIRTITFYNRRWVDGRNPPATSTHPWENKLGKVHFLSGTQFKRKI